MILNRAALILVFIVLSIAGSAQNRPTLGKFGLGLEGFVNMPLLSGAPLTCYKYTGNEMKSAREWVNVGGQAFLIRKMNNKYGIGAGFGIKQFLLSSPDYFVSSFSALPDYQISDTTWLRMESLSYHTYSGLLLAEFYPKSGVGLIGFSHRIGLGFSITKPGYRSYKYSLNEYGKDDSENWTIPDTYLANRDTIPSYKSVTLFYGIQMRYPLSKHLAIDMGVSYLFNIYFRPSEDKLNSNVSPPINISDNFFNVQRENLVSLNLKGGLTILF